MSEWIKVVILGIVEGITEFLPISSTGHLIVAAALLNFQNSLGGAFEIFIQLGAVVAVIAFYWRDLFQQVRNAPTSPQTRRFWFGIVIACVPAAALGFLLRGWITDTLFHPVVVAASLIIGGIVFLIIERQPQRETITEETLNISLRQALFIGLVQTIALIPGVSRSGASIIGGMQAGLSRKAATQFSFYLSIPTLGGATLVELLDVLGSITNDQLALFMLGAVVSGIIAWLSIAWLLRYVASNTFVAFGYYRIIAGVVILLAVGVGLV